MEWLEVLGLVSIIVLNIGWWVQVYKVVTTKKCEDLSLAFMGLGFVSFIGLQIYTIEYGNMIYILGNQIGMTGVGILFLLKVLNIKGKWGLLPEQV